MGNRKPSKLLVTCEHGGNDVPSNLRCFFATVDARRNLHSHRGYDPGALIVAQCIASHFRTPLQYSTISRLVVDLNRSLESHQLFSKFIVHQDPKIRQLILDAYYVPYRKKVIEQITDHVNAGYQVLHLSIHTFTPRYRGTDRKFDLGVLFDPRRSWESRCSKSLLTNLDGNGLRVLPNQPYLGTDDGLTTTLRTMFEDACYAGIELELNNRIAKRSEKLRLSWCHKIKDAIATNLITY
jgi:predicted N-formylglutamate amidohydrolase